MNLTEADIKKHISTHQHECCPACGSDDLSGDTMAAEGTGVFQDNTCNKCSTSWHSTWRHKRTLLIDPKEGTGTLTSHTDIDSCPVCASQDLTGDWPLHEQSKVTRSVECNEEHCGAHWSEEFELESMTEVEVEED